MNISINHQSYLKPCAAIILYHSGTDAAAIMHDIRKDGRLSAGRHLDMDMLEEIFRSSGKQGRMKCLTGEKPAGIEQAFRQECDLAAAYFRDPGRNVVLLGAAEQPPSYATDTALYRTTDAHQRSTG